MTENYYNLAKEMMTDFGIDTDRFLTLGYDNRKPEVSEILYFVVFLESPRILVNCYSPEHKFNVNVLHANFNPFVNPSVIVNSAIQIFLSLFENYEELKRAKRSYLEKYNRPRPDEPSHLKRLELLSTAMAGDTLQAELDELRTKVIVEGLKNTEFRFRDLITPAIEGGSLMSEVDAKNLLDLQQKKPMTTGPVSNVLTNFNRRKK